MLIHAGRRSSLLREGLFPRQGFLNYVRQEKAERKVQASKQEAWVCLFSCDFDGGCSMANCLRSCLDVPDMVDVGL